LILREVYLSLARAERLANAGGDGPGITGIRESTSGDQPGRAPENFRGAQFQGHPGERYSAGGGCFHRPKTLHKTAKEALGSFAASVGFEPAALSPRQLSSCCHQRRDQHSKNTCFSLSLTKRLSSKMTPQTAQGVRYRCIVGDCSDFGHVRKSLSGKVIRQYLLPDSGPGQRDHCSASGSPQMA